MQTAITFSWLAPNTSKKGIPLEFPVISVCVVQLQIDIYAMSCTNGVLSQTWEVALGLSFPGGAQ